MTKSHFSIDLGVLTAIRQLVEAGSTIVELGSGNGTNRLVKEYEVYSIEDDEKWVGYCDGSNYIHAPLVSLENKGEDIKWYDLDCITRGLPEKYDLILVDGPSGKKGRSGLLANLDIFRTDVPFVIDDTLREHECNIAREMAFLLNRPLYMFWNFSIISPNALTEEQITRIQKAALQVLENEELPYLSSYFSEPEPIVEIDLESLDLNINKINNENLKIASLKASERKLNAVEKSISLRLGKVITSPLRFISLLLKRGQ
jgi:hypothetical protein